MHDRLGKRLMRWRHRVVLPQLRGRVLDVGCGYNGLVAAYRRGAGSNGSPGPSGHGAAESVGVDVYPWEGADVIVADTAELDFPDGGFDTVTIVAALNHIPNRLDVLREAHRVLAPGGRVVLTMIPPRMSWAWHTLRRPWDADQTERGMKEGEVYGLSNKQVLDLVRQAGFEPVVDRRFMVGLNRLTVAEKVPTPAPVTVGHDAPVERRREPAPTV